MDFAAIVTNVVAAFAHVGGQALDAAQTTAEALLIALTILAALFQTSKLVTVLRMLVMAKLRPMHMRWPMLKGIR